LRMLEKRPDRPADSERASPFSPIVSGKCTVYTTTQSLSHWTVKGVGHPRIGDVKSR
jgi:hypothetical protein